MNLKLTKITSVAILLLTIIIQAANCYNVLFLFSYGSKSHRHTFEPVAKELAKRGHQVTLFATSKGSGEDEKGITNIHHTDGAELFYNPEMSAFKGSLSNLTRLKEKLGVVNDLARSFYQHPFIADLVKEPIDPKTKKPKFDIVIVDMVWNDFATPLAHHMGVPNILFSPTFLILMHALLMDIPYPISYVPVGLVDVGEPMTFLQRVYNTFYGISYLRIFFRKSLPELDGIVREFLPQSPCIADVIKNVSFIFTNSHFATHAISPGMPYYVELGGIHCKPAKSLPKDLEEFMQSSKDEGVIYFSLGSITSGDSMPVEMRHKIIEAFSQLPQKILFKFEHDLKNLPSNVKIIKWAPQQDLLAHPKMQLFISHGGGLSVGEAAYHGCPILGFPLSADQKGNVVQARIKGFGEFLEWRTFTSQQLLDLIKKMLNDDSYRANAKLASKLLQDRPQPPVETAAYWIEYVTRHNGAPFLKSRGASSLNFFQYFLIDIFAVIFGILAIFILILGWICKYICKKLGCCKWSCNFLNCSGSNKKSTISGKITKINEKKLKIK